jgi:tetratricopeptide (TPR) repeat protein
LEAGIAMTAERRLGPVDAAASDRRKAFEAAARAFARLLGKQVRALEAPDLSVPPHDSMLFVHMAALIALEESAGTIPVEEAVAIRRGLAGARPDAFLPDLAMSLNNLSNCLANLGRREEALGAIEEAVAIRRELAGARPRRCW